VLKYSHLARGEARARTRVRLIDERVLGLLATTLTRPKADETHPVMGSRRAGQAE
jgi:hypothetical protein